MEKPLPPPSTSPARTGSAPIPFFTQAASFDELWPEIPRSLRRYPGPGRVLARRQGRGVRESARPMDRCETRRRCQLGHRRAGATAARRRAETRRRGHRPRLHLRRHGQFGGARRGRARLRRRRGARVRDRSAVRGGRGDLPHPDGHAGAPVRPPRGHAGRARDGAAARADRPGGQRRSRRHASGRHTRRAARRRRGAVVLPDQDPRCHRRRRGAAHRRRRRRRGRAGTAPPRPRRAHPGPLPRHRQPHGALRCQQQDGRHPGRRPARQTRPSRHRHRPQGRALGALRQPAARHPGGVRASRRRPAAPRRQPGLLRPSHRGQGPRRPRHAPGRQGDRDRDLLSGSDAPPAVLRPPGHAPGDFPRAEAACAKALALPLYPDLAEWQVDRVCDEVEDFYTGRRR